MFAGISSDLSGRVKARAFDADTGGNCGQSFGLGAGQRLLFHALVSYCGLDGQRRVEFVRRFAKPDFIERVLGFLETFMRN